MLSLHDANIGNAITLKAINRLGNQAESGDSKDCLPLLAKSGADDCTRDCSLPASRRALQDYPALPCRQFCAEF
jgi:hypothetical protein